MEKDKATKTIAIEVAYGDSQEQWIYTLEVLPSCTVKEAIMQSDILQHLSTALENYGIGIFGIVASLDKTVKEGDRIEIYRPLIRDPKRARRDKAKAAKKLKSAGKKR